MRHVRDTCESRLISSRRYIHPSSENTYADVCPLYLFFLAGIQGTSGSRVKNGVTRLYSLSQMSSLS